MFPAVSDPSDVQFVQQIVPPKEKKPVPWDQLLVTLQTTLQLLTKEVGVLRTHIGSLENRVAQLEMAQTQQEKFNHLIGLYFWQSVFPQEERRQIVARFPQFARFEEPPLADLPPDPSSKRARIQHPAAPPVPSPSSSSSESEIERLKRAYEQLLRKVNEQSQLLSQVQQPRPSPPPVSSTYPLYEQQEPLTRPQHSPLTPHSENYLLDPQAQDATLEDRANAEQFFSFLPLSELGNRSH